MNDKLITKEELLTKLNELQQKYDALSDSSQIAIVRSEEAKEVFLQSERLLREALFVARLGTYVWDVSTGFWKSSAILDDIFGIDEKYTRSLEGWADLIHPDWREKITVYLTNEVLGKNKRFDKEYKIIRNNDGKARWVHGLGEVELDDYNNPKLLIGTITDITDRKVAEEARISTESNLQALINNKNESIWSLDKKYNLIVCNDYFRNSYLAAYNYNLQLGVNLIEILSPELKEFWKPKYDKALAGEKVTFEFEETIQGMQFYFDVFLNPIISEGEITGVSALSVDVSERRRSEQELRESELRFSQLANASFEGIGISDNDVIIDANEQLSKLLGYTHEELIGRNFMDFVAPESQKIVADNKKSQTLVPYEHLTIRKDGSVFPVEIQSRTVPYKGRIVRVTAIRDITERKRAEDAVITSEKKFRLFVENAFEGIMAADKYDKITFVNQRMAEMIGYSPEEILGQHFDFFIFPEEISDFNQKMIDRRQGVGEVFERKYKRKDGSVLWVLVSASPIFNTEGFYTGSLGMITDITDRKAADEILRESEERFRSVTESANDAIITVNSKGMISGWNRGAVKLFGYDTNEITGYDIEFIIPQLSVENQKLGIKIPDHLREYDFAGKTMELTGKHKNGRVFPLEMSLAEWETATGKYFTGIIRDITDRKKAEDALIYAKEKAEESDRLKTSFLGNMSHEVRTPMNGILGFAGLLKNPMLTSEEKNEYLSIIEHSGLRMLNVLNDLIDISKIESGQMEVTNSLCNINEIMNFIFAFFKPEVEQKGLKFSLKIDLPDDKAIIKTDLEKLNAILTNLVKNAVKFTNEGAIEFGYVLKTGGRDKASLVSTQPEIEFYVKDTGIGIKEDLKEIIFERFRQGSESLTRNYEGAGLGLSISKSYVKMLGGKIWVENNPENFHGQSEGSVFYFTVPYSEHENQAISNDEIPGEYDTQSLPELKVLITEDHEASERLLFKIISSFSNKIIIARTGFEAVEACHKNPDIDLILMDIKMPVMDGFEATRQIRNFNKSIVIIAQTAYALASDKILALEAGCNDYISKPINKELLMILIKKYFNKKGPAGK